MEVRAWGNLGGHGVGMRVWAWRHGYGEGSVGMVWA